MGEHVGVRVTLQAARGGYLNAPEDETLALN
jgi:hypothetical protein